MESELYSAHAKLEDHHWWFSGRRAVVREVLKQRVAPVEGRRILDVGCGTGGMLSMLREFGDVEGIDSSDEALAYARERLGPDAKLGKGELPDGIPEGRTYQLITAFDVIEHIPDAVAALKSIHGALEPGGVFVCTVPAFQFLWSVHDDLNHHQRRYDAELLKAQLSTAGFELRFTSYFNSLLFPPIAAVRLLQKVMPEKPGSTGAGDLDEAPPLVNGLLKRLFSAERHLLKRASLPFGVSLIAVASRW